MKLESNVTRATIISKVPHPTLKGVTLQIIKVYKDGKWEEDRVDEVLVPKGTRFTTDGQHFYTAKEDQHKISPGYRENSVYFVLPDSNKVYSFNNKDVEPAKNNKRTKALLTFVQYTVSDLPKILAKLKASKAQVVRTTGAAYITILILNGNYLNIGCHEAYDILLKNGIINKDGFVVKTRLPEEVVSAQFHNIDKIIKQIGDIYAQAT